MPPHILKRSTRHALPADREERAALLEITLKTIQELREEREWTQVDLATKVGVSVGTVYNWERGKYEPRVTQFRQIAKIFEVSMDTIELVGDDQLNTTA